MNYDSIHRGFTTSASYTAIPSSPRFITWISYEDYKYEQKWLREKQEYLYNIGVDPFNTDIFRINKLKLKVV